MATDKADRPTVNILETAALLQDQCRQIEDERSGGVQNLREREKQVKFLGQFFDLASRTDLSLEDFIREFLDLIPTLWQHPDETSARVFLNNQEYRTTNFIVESDWKFSSGIVLNDQPIGSFEVFYVEGYPDDYQGVLIWSESAFLEMIVTVIASFFQKSQASEKLRMVNDQYENIVQSHQKLENRIGGFVPKLKLMNEKFQKTIETKNIFIKQIAREILYQVDKSKSGFADDVNTSHEVKQSNPILDQLIRLGEKVEQYVDCEAGNFVLENKPFSIRSMLAEVLKEVGGKAVSQKVNIIPMINPLIPDKVSGNGPKLKQIITYLIDYALEVSKGGQVIVKVELEASAHLLPIYSFSIVLTGCHDSETEPSRILSLKSGLNTETENDFMISRLGVVISRQLVELMGGEIWIEGGSEVGGEGHPGISFQFTTWLDIDKKHDERTFCLDLPDTASYQIFAADQNSAMCEMLNDYFAALGFAITSISDINRASEILQNSVDLKSEWLMVIIDAQLAGDDGKTLLTLATENGWLKDTPIILIGPESYRELAVSQGFDPLIRFAPKPFDFWHFDLLVRQVLDKIKPVEAVGVDDDNQVNESPEGRSEAGEPENDLLEEEGEKGGKTESLDHQQGGNERLGIISPDKVTRIMLSKILEKQGFEIEAVASTSEMDEAVTKGKVDGILIDLHPNLTDPPPDKFVQKIRLAENFTGRHIPIIMIISPESSNDGKEPNLELAEATGVDRVINIGDGYGPMCEQIRSLLDEFKPHNGPDKADEVGHEDDDLVFDRQTALKLANDDLDLLLELLEVFDEEADEYMSQMKLAVQMQKPSELNQAARALEHSASKIGAVDIKRQATGIAESIEEDGLSGIGQPLQKLQGSLERFAQEAARYEKSVAM